MTGGEIATIVSALVVAILTGGVGKALVDYRRDRKKVPLETDSIAVANTKELLGMAGMLTKTLHDEMGRMQRRFDEEIAEVKSELREASAGLAKTKIRLDQAERDLEAERQQRIALSRRTDGLESVNMTLESYILRSWENIRRDHPDAWQGFLPVPGVLTDPGFPATPRLAPVPVPADDGQPANPDTLTPEGTP